MLAFALGSVGGRHGLGLGFLFDFSWLSRGTSFGFRKFDLRLGRAFGDGWRGLGGRTFFFRRLGLTLFGFLRGLLLRRRRNSVEGSGEVVIDAAVGAKLELEFELEELIDEFVANKRGNTDFCVLAGNIGLQTSDLEVEVGLGERGEVPLLVGTIKASGVFC